MAQRSSRIIQALSHHWLAAVLARTAVPPFACCEAVQRCACVNFGKRKRAQKLKISNDEVVRPSSGHSSMTGHAFA